MSNPILSNSISRSFAMTSTRRSCGGGRESEGASGTTTQHTLTPIQRAIKTRIAECARRESCTQIEYRSEWLGYLPYGCYQWITCNGSDIDLVLEENWGSDDLDALQASGFLVKISESINPEDDTERAILYSVDMTR